MGAEVKSMDIKKTQQTATEHAVTSKRLREFIADIKSEIQKITWTSREELKVYTKLVIFATFIFGISIYLLDLMIHAVLNGLNLLLYFI